MEKMEKEAEGFWVHTPLNEMTAAQWESLCDGCGKCWLFKVQDETTHQIRTTKVGCRLLDIQTCRCSNYKERFRYVDDCIKLNAANVQTITWLPKSCAYRLIKKRNRFRIGIRWLPKIPYLPVKGGHTVRGFVVPPALVRNPLIDYLLEEEIS